jgi:hypothetical protein
VTVNVAARNPALEVNVATVIIYQGPGSWKREARWDEYVVDVTNRGTAPLTIESVSLVDALAEPQLLGTDPWELEGRTESNWRAYGRFALYTMGAGVIAGGSLGLAYGAAYGAAGSAVASLTAAAPMVWLANVSVVEIMNGSNKRHVTAEFDRRRLRLPLYLNPGSTVQGSLFFPVTPGPQKLILGGRAGDAPLELMLDLKVLAGLHVNVPAQ